MLETPAPTAASAPRVAVLPILADPADIPVYERPRHERATRLAVLVFAILLFLPNVGAFGLWDPWETHYGEVTRNMVETHDWVSPWWGFKEKIGTEAINGEQFFSKPIFIFWVEAVSMSAFGYSDFAIRLPVALLAIFSTLIVYWGMSRVAGRRVGLFSALVMATSPMFFMIARQAQTDMPFVAMLTVALMFFLVAVFGPREPTSDGRFWRRVGLFLALFLLSTLPQFAFLSTDLQAGANVAALPAGDQLLFTIRQNGLWHVVLFYLPLTLGLLTVLAVRYVRAWRAARRSGQGLTDAFKDRELRNLYLYTFYVFMAHATLAKGLLGFMLPGFIILVFLAITWDWRLLWNGKERTARGPGVLRILSGIVIFVVVSFPWYVAMFAKFGQAFYTRFFVHDHFNRLGAGVHQIDTGTFEHFLKWLGIGTFPWIALVPVALLWLFRKPLFERTREGRLALFVFLWAFLSYCIFTLAKTKFHHYIFPALPPLAILVALFLAHTLKTRTRLIIIGALIGIGVYAACSWDLLVQKQHLRNLMTYKYDRPLPEHLPIDAGDIVQTGSYATWADSQFFKHTTELQKAILTSPALRYESFLPFVIVVGGVGLLLFLFVGPVAPTGPPAPAEGAGAPTRRSPVRVLKDLVRAPRRLAVYVLGTAGTLLTVWSLNYYLPMLSPHWSQKYLFEALYSDCTLMQNDPETDRAYTPLILRLGLDGLFDALGSTKKRVCEEDVVSWLLTWRGETYYSYNEIQPINKEATQMDAYMTERNRGQPFYLFMERGKTASMESKLNSYTAKYKKKLDANFQDIDSWVVETIFDESEYFMLAKATPQRRKGPAPAPAPAAPPTAAVPDTAAPTAPAVPAGGY